MWVEMILEACFKMRDPPPNWTEVSQSNKSDSGVFIYLFIYFAVLIQIRVIDAF